jgi:hypothetical protein
MELTNSTSGNTEITNIDSKKRGRKAKQENYFDVLQIAFNCLKERVVIKKFNKISLSNDSKKNDTLSKNSS